MSVLRQDVCFTIPTHRSGRIITLDSFKIPKGFTALVLADPKILKDVRREYKGQSRIEVVRGDVGLSRQGIACYDQARKHGFRWAFRMDDDLSPNTFLHMNGKRITDLERLVDWSMECADRLNVTLAGFQNTANRSWMAKGYGPSYSLVAGPGCLMNVEHVRGKDVMHPDMSFLDDVWRSCAHRLRDNRVGRVRFVGLDWSDLLKIETSITANTKVRRHWIKAVCRQFPTCIEQTGWRDESIAMPILKWKRHPEYISA